MIIEDSIIIDAPMEKVWDTFIDLACWDEWNTVISNVKYSEKCLANCETMKCTFRPFFFPVAVKINIDEVMPYEKIIWTARKKGLIAHHIFLFKKVEKGIQVVSRETFAGILSAGSGFLLPVKRMKELTRIFLLDLKRASEG